MADDDKKTPAPLWDAKALGDFYASDLGRVVRHLITRKLTKQIFNDTASLKSENCVAAGLGYPQPYWRFLEETFGNVIGLETITSSKHPKTASGFAQVDRAALPLLPSSLDALFVIHALEDIEASPALLLDEAWRVLKSSGRLVMVIPHRGSVWASREHTPFGHGQPYSVNQLRSLVKEQGFEVARIHQALLAPPFRFYRRFALLVERLPNLFGGVLIVDAYKMVYSVTELPVHEKKGVLRPTLTSVKTGLTRDSET